MRHESGGARVIYPVTVADPRIDREAWARLLAELIQQETGGNQTHFSIAVGVDRKTVSRWLKAEVDVSEDKVRAVARALGVPVAELLVKVGYYQAGEMPDEPVRPAAPEEDPAVQVILASDAPPSLKRELVAYLREQRAEQERQRIEEARRLLSVAQRARRRRAG